MAFSRIAIFFLAARSLATALSRRSSISNSVPDFEFDGDAPFTVDSNDLAESLTCPNGYPSIHSPPVLLVHGTATTGDESWGDGFVPALYGNGYTACFINIPNRSMGDMQVNAEYVAYNLHYISFLSGGLPTAVISHSQGGPNTQWALQFWPSTRNCTRAFIALSPDFAGIDLLGSSSLLNGICADGLCQASMWQQAAGSNYYKALHSGGFAARIPTTSIWTQFDGVVLPVAGNAQLPGATIVSIQNLCPLRPDTHFTMTISSAGYALALDALNHGGIASLSRLRWSMFSICFRVTAQGMQPDIASDIESLFENLVKGFLNVAGLIDSEPAIAPYAQ